MENYIKDYTIKDRGNGIVYIYHAFYFPFGWTFKGTLQEAEAFCQAKSEQVKQEEDQLNDILDR